MPVKEDAVSTDRTPKLLESCVAAALRQRAGMQVEVPEAAELRFVRSFHRGGHCLALPPESCAPSFPNGDTPAVHKAPFQRQGAVSTPHSFGLFSHCEV